MTTEIRKYWLADDKQSSLGSWPIETPDDEIWAELHRAECFVDNETGFVKQTGSIEVGEWTE